MSDANERNRERIDRLARLGAAQASVRVENQQKIKRLSPLEQAISNEHLNALRKKKNNVARKLVEGAALGNRIDAIRKATLAATQNERIAERFAASEPKKPNTYEKYVAVTTGPNTFGSARKQRTSRKRSNRRTPNGRRRRNTRRN